MIFSQIRLAVLCLLLSSFSNSIFSQVDTIPPVISCDSVLITRIWNTSPPRRLIGISEVLNSAFDNVTPNDSLQIGLCLDDCEQVLHPDDRCTGQVPLNPNGTVDTLVVMACVQQYRYNTTAVVLTAQDLAGNLSTCRTELYIYDNGICHPPHLWGIYGRVKKNTPFGLQGLNNVIIDVSIGPDTSINLNSVLPYHSDTTPVYGDFSIVNTLYSGPIGFQTPKHIKPRKTNDWANGVNAFDLLLLQRHLLGTKPLQNTEQIIAADANNSRSLTPSDITELRKLILGINTSLPNNTSWRFIPSGYNFSNPQNPFIDTFPEQTTYNFEQLYCTNFEFRAIKIGDLDYSASNNLTQTDDRTESKFFTFEDKSFEKGDIVAVELKNTTDKPFYQFSLKHKDLEFIEVKNIQTEDDLYFFRKNENLTSFINEQENENPTLLFHARNKGTLHAALSFANVPTQSLAFDDLGKSSPLYLKNKAIGKKPLLQSIYPNPFSDIIRAQGTAWKAQEVRIELFDLRGQLVHSQINSIENGTFNIEIEPKKLQEATYFLQLIFENGDVLTEKIFKQKS